MSDADIRIAPIRRSTVSPDAWGLHSVPSMLNDFQRHTSRANFDVEQIEETSSGNRVIQLLSFIALPTALLAVSHACLDAQANALYVFASCLPTSLLFTTIPLHHLLIGLGSAITSVSVLESDGARNTAVIAALACMRINLNEQSLFSLRSLWLFLLISVVSLSTFNYKLSACAFVLLLLLAFSNMSGGRRSRNMSILGYGVALFALGAAVVYGKLTNRTLASCFIASCSLGMFFVVGTSPSRFDCLICGVLASAVEVIVQGHLHVQMLLEVLLLVPSVFLQNQNTSPKAESVVPGAWSILDSILAHDDTRSIFYFFCLNFSFMLVQLLYSLLSHSLGLLSDSIHMFFDCLALLVGLVASILAKLPASSRFPYGLHMVETVSGFANGCLLLAISVGVLFEAFERIANPVELEKLTELVVVSSLGLVVNFVGIFAFNHAHSHGGHSHSHETNHSHSHDHTHSHDHDHSHSHASTESCEGSDNMHGIFLHIVADTLGSVGVILSTLLLAWTGWHGWDAVASICISILIFASAIPLVRSSAKTLLLGLKERDERQLREILNDVYNLEGVASYTVPKFWNDGKGIRGTIHIQYKPSHTAKRVQETVRAVIASGGIHNVTIQVEEQGSKCWCQNVK